MLTSTLGKYLTDEQSSMRTWLFVLSGWWRHRMNTECHSFKTLRFFLVIRLICSHRMTFMLMTWKISYIFSTVIASITIDKNIKPSDHIYYTRYKYPSFRWSTGYKLINLSVTTPRCAYKSSTPPWPVPECHWRTCEVSTLYLENCVNACRI